jgi:ArsR family transcriptional regulator, lead/cadmium/zinc/bismuth-responsive transcriptional repressor
LYPKILEKELSTLSMHQEHHHPAGRPQTAGDTAIERAARIFRAVGDIERLRLLALLTQGEACVTELAASMQAELPTISQRLRVLRNEGLIVRRREGKHIYYALTDEHIVALILNALGHANEVEEPRNHVPAAGTGLEPREWP